MDDRFNTASGWVLFSGIVALGSFIVSGMYFHANSTPELEEGEFGYWVKGEEVANGPKEMSIAEAMTMDGVTASAGENVFAKCTACHTIDQGGANGIGPNLYGIMGKAVGGGAAGFAYSSALVEKGGQWDWETMSEWLKSPRGFANGTKMSFAGLSKIEDRAAVMLFMNNYGSNLPVPEFVAEVAEGADAPGAGPGPVEGAEVGAVEAAGAMSADQPVAEN